MPDKVLTISDDNKIAPRALAAIAASDELSTAIGESAGVVAWKPSTAYTVGQRVVHPNGDVKVSLTNHTSGTSSPGTVNWADPPTVASEITTRKRDLGRQQRQRVYTRPRAVKIANLPGALGWTPPAGFALFFDGVRYFTKYDAASRKITGGMTRYVHTVTGNDTTGNGTEGSPWATLAKAHTSSSDGDTIRFLDTGIVYRNSLNANAVMYKALNLIADPAATFVAGDNLTYTATSGQPGVYQATRSNVQRVVDLLIDPNGFRYTEVGSIAACQALPGSWFSDGTTLYVRTIDGTAPVSTRIIALLSVSLFEWGIVSRTSDGGLYMENLRALNGSQGVKVTASAAYDIPFTAKGCKFLHGHLSAADGVQLFDVGSSVIQDTLVAHTAKDGFNYHQSNRVTQFLEIDTEAHSIGLDRGTDYTMNGSTAHDGIKGVRIGGSYHHTNGTPVADVQTGTKTANYSCDAWDSLAPTGNSYNAGFAAQQPGAEIWLSRCRAWGTSSDLYAVTGTTMHVDDLSEYDSRNGGGTFDLVSVA